MAMQLLFMGNALNSTDNIATNIKMANGNSVEAEVNATNEKLVKFSVDTKNLTVNANSWSSDIAYDTDDKFCIVEISSNSGGNRGSLSITNNFANRKFAVRNDGSTNQTVTLMVVHGK